jgi:ribosomal protein S18 acetylase RimI-like enzyme
MLRALIRDGARDGAFDPALAWDSPNAERFFTELRQALKTGYFVVSNALTGAVDTVAVPGYVYWPDDDAGSPPAGFGLFRAVGDGYELWLAGLEATLRGQGHGRSMLTALFATPTGKRTRHMRVRRSARHADAIARLLAEQGFTPTRETATETWFVRATPHVPAATRRP